MPGCEPFQDFGFTQYQAALLPAGSGKTCRRALESCYGLVYGHCLPSLYLA